MGRFVEGQDRRQAAFPPECLDDYFGADNPVRLVDAFIDELDLLALGFTGARLRQRADLLIIRRPC